METFGKLFASLLRFVYHCFDRLVIQGYLPLLTRPEHIVYFFRDVHGISPLPSRRCGREPATTNIGWKPSLATIASPCSGPTPT